MQDADRSCRCALSGKAALAICVLLACAGRGSAAPAAATLLDGSKVEGTITSWDPTGVTLETAEGERRLASDSLLAIDWSREQPAGPEGLQVELVDGTQLRCTQFSLKARRVQISGDRIEIAKDFSRDLLKVVTLQPNVPGLAPLLDEISGKGLAGDSLVIVKRDGASIDYLTGVLGEVTDELASFTWEGDELPVKRTKIAAIAFYQARQQQMSTARCHLTLTDGSLVVARDIALADDKLSVTTTSGVSLTISLTDVAHADFSSGKVAYLSDLKPTSVQWTPRIALPPGAESIARIGLPRLDESFSGSALTLIWTDAARSRRDVRTYAKGLALRSRTETAYRIPDGMRRFIAYAGIDPETVQQGHVVLRIMGDDQVLWEGEIDGAGPPQEIALELGAARRLHVVVDYGKNLDYGDRLHLAEARLTK